MNNFTEDLLEQLTNLVDVGYENYKVIVNVVRELVHVKAIVVANN